MAKLTPDDAERLFSSRIEDDDPELGSLAAFVREVRETYTRAPDAHTQAAHLRAMADAFDAAPKPAPVRRRRRLVSRAALAGAAASVVLAGSALAATGHLPAPAQNAVANAFGHVGVTIPKATHASPAGQEHGDAGKARAAANRARAKEFTDAKKEWTDCVAAKASEHSGPGGFDPEAPEPEGCGSKPRAQDFQPTRTNPAGNENHGKGPEPQGAGPSNEGPGSSDEHGNGHGQPGGPNAATGPSGEGPGNGVGRGHGNGGGPGPK